MKILTQNKVKKLHLDQVSIITADMLEGYDVIGDRAFNAFNFGSSLTSITIPDSVKSIGEYAFAYCYSLTSITIPNSVTHIEDGVFFWCHSLTSVTIPNSVTRIGYGVFSGCSSLTSVTIGDKTYEQQEIVDGKCKAYKAFKSDLTCRGYQYKEGETFIMEEPIEICKQGFHACLNLRDVFNYYSGEIGKDFVIHEVELENPETENKNININSKAVTNKITIGKRIL